MGDFWALERVARLKEASGADARPVWKRLEKALLVDPQMQGHSHANYLLGIIYLDGRSGNPDAALGVSYLTTAKDLGSKPATDRLSAYLAAKPIAGSPRALDRGQAAPAA